LRFLRDDMMGVVYDNVMWALGQLGRRDRIQKELFDAVMGIPVAILDFTRECGLLGDQVGVIEFVMGISCV
jgi:hypothetical protein